MSDKQKESLAKARELAWAKRKELAEVSGKERDLDKKMKLLALEKRKKKVESKLEKLTNDIPDYSSSSSESEAESVEPIKKVKPVKVVQQKEIEKVIETVVEKPQIISADQARELLKNKILRESQANAFSSLFPGAVNPFL